MVERLANGNTTRTLLGNALTTDSILIDLIVVFGPISGAHGFRARVRRRISVPCHKGPVGEQLFR